MSDRHELPSGGWVAIRDTKVVTERQRRKTRLLYGRVSPDGLAYLSRKTPAPDPDADPADTPAKAEGGLSPADAEIMYELNDLVAVEMIEAWSFDLPVTVDSIVELATGDYDEIQRLTSPHVWAFFGLDFDPTPDLATPTEPSNG